MNKKTICIWIIWMTILLYLLSVLSIVVSDGRNLKYLIWHGGTAGVFPDLMQTVWESKGLRPYSAQTVAIYPPLTYLICAVLAYSIPGSLDFSASLSPNGILVLSLFLVGVISAVIVMIYNCLKVEKSIKIIIVTAFMLSAPFIYMLERGNTVLLSVFFCLCFIFYYDSSSKIKREMAICCLAIAASIKLYPALLGILLLTSKKYKDSIRCIVYGILIFSIPIFFIGGISEMKGMLEGIKYFQAETISDKRNFGYGFKVGLTNWILAMGEYFNINIEKSVVINRIMIIIVLLILFLIIVYAKEKWEKVTASLFILVLVPTFSWIYNVTYMIGGVILFVNYIYEKKMVTLKDTIYAMLFVAMFVPLPYGEVLINLHGVNKISISTIVCSVAMIVMMVMLFADCVTQLKYRLCLRKK